MNRLLSFIVFFIVTVSLSAQTVVKEGRQQHFKSVPKGNYSGIVPLGNDRYAVVSDKSTEDGFFVFHIDIDTISGKILSIQNEGFRSSHLPNRDMEGITYLPSEAKILISGETDNEIYAYDTLGNRSETPFPKASVFNHQSHNLGLESLTHNEVTGKIWTCNENQNDSIFLQSYTATGQLDSCYLYMLDKRTAPTDATNYAHGVSELCALDDGRLLVLEREFYVSPSKIGSWVECKLYVTDFKSKRLVTSWKTQLSLLNFALANYEGMCIARRLSNGNIILLLCADSQNQYAGVLRDWFKTFIISF
ncbi:MAG: esterase-like activity of phytase family protein [Prevotella sp.]|jgi:uncharacterized protein YjiK